MNHEIDPSRHKYPYCIVWSPLPPITWIFPFIGHTGIADSKGICNLSLTRKGRVLGTIIPTSQISFDTAAGVIFDFAGPYTINRGNFAFGKILEFYLFIVSRYIERRETLMNLNSSASGAPTRYIQLDALKCRDADWDTAIAQGCDVYSQRMHNICYDNCHSHVVKCLNVMGYDNKRSYNMVDLACWFFFSGKFPTAKAFILTILPFTILVAFIILISVYLK